MGWKLAISNWRLTINAKVGVCTRPIESTCLFWPYLIVYKRVAFIPSSQSPIARESPASYNDWKSDWSFNLEKPSRIASSVKEEIHKRLTGQRAPAFCITQRWINSPSWPASPQLIISSAFCINCSIIWNCFSIPGSCPISLIPKRGGIIGKLPKLHDFQLGVYSCGSFKVQRCPNVQVTWYPFPSIYPSFLVWAPSTSAISRATDGFSAMQTIILSPLVFILSVYKVTWLFLTDRMKIKKSLS